MGVTTIAVAAGRVRGLDPDDLDELRRAALIHDLGRVGVTTVIWDRTGPLSDDDWEEVRLHAYVTESVASRVPWLAAPARIAALHHERLDGSGYHRRAEAHELSTPARLLAAADCYHALIEMRPHRPAYDAVSAASILQSEANAGRLDGTAVRCVLEAAGHTRRRLRCDLPAGLTEREVDVLRVIALGSTIKQTARALHVSPKTVDTHVQHIYGKVGCSTRAGAAVFAMKHGLLEPSWSQLDGSQR
jgi:HD-GYP domain-containing protein (c-di-GMP phosphodiesterase class II)